MHQFHLFKKDILSVFRLFTNRTMLIFFLIPLLLSCSKKDLSSPASVVHLVTGPGTPEGTAITKTIGSSGGTIVSADSNISITIPPGALSSDQTITVQPVSNQLPSGYGKAYRLTPHDISFEKPVTIRFRYDENSIRNTVPELLAIGYQNQTGQWFHTSEPVLDKQNHTLSVNSTHFSDWGFFPYFYIEPGEKLIDPGGQLDLKVMATFAPGDFDLPDLPGGVVTEVYEPSATFVGAWSYAGEGALNGNGTRAHYNAPNSAPRVNPEAVSVAVKTKRKGQLLLVSNITIRTDLHIDYMQVDETERSSGGLDYASRLWLYGSFGEDPGKDKRSVTINGGDVKVAYWTPGWIACDIPTAGPMSSGMVAVRSGEKTTSKKLNEWIVEMYYDQKQSPDGALTKKVGLVLHLRGDADGFLRTGQEAKVHETDLNAYCRALIDMPGGTFTTHVTMDACGSYTVNWDQIHGVQIERKKDGAPGFEGLRGRVVNRPDGFDIKIRFLAEDVLTTHRKFTSCEGSNTIDHVKEYIQIEGYHEVTIPLRFSGSGSDVSIKAGQMPTKTGSPAAGLYWDAPSYNPQQFTINLHWDEGVLK